MTVRRSSPEWKAREWLPLWIFVAALALWEWGGRSGRVSALFFPAPSIIVATTVRLFTSGKLTAHLGATLSRLLPGFVLGALPAYVLGLAMGWSKRLRAIVDPFVAAAHPIPKISTLPLVMIVFGIGESSKLIVVAIAVFFPLLISTMAGVRQISPILLEVAQNYGASTRKTFTRIIVPGSLPYVTSGIRLALNSALVLTIAVELVAARHGMGAMIWLAWETLRTEELFAALLVTATLGIGFSGLLQYATPRLLPWQVDWE